MDSQLFGDIFKAIEGRNDWELRQECWSQMRNKGIRRRAKPYPGAPDKHYPLADSMIEKLKPMYVAQLYANDQLAQFQPWVGQDAALTTAAAEWFDYQLKQKSNFETEIYCAIDGMLQNGFGIIKVYWDPNKKQLCFCTVDPLHLIIPPLTEGLQSTDWGVHVCRMSVAQYKKNKNFKQDDDLIARIKGRGNDKGGSVKEQQQELAEGISCAKDDEILLWEVYYKAKDDPDAPWMVCTVAPAGGCDAEVRDVFELDFPFLPFFKIQHEITENKSWYASRGITEIIAPHESALCKLWNNLYQFLDFHGVPTYTQTGTTIVNGDNFTNRPGAILPAGIEPTAAGSAPIDFEQQLQFTRAVAEDRVSVPDLGSGQHLGGLASSRNERVTATQINAIVGQSGQSNDLRARLFRLQLGMGYNMAWQLLTRYNKTELGYVYSGAVKQMPVGALHNNYQIIPNFSPDSWNKGQELQRRLALYQVLQGSPYSNKGESLKWLLEAGNPHDVSRLYQDPNAANEEQVEDQATECLLMEEGFVPNVQDSDDDIVHLTTMVQRVQRKLQSGQTPDPETARAFLMHGNDHTQQATAKKNPQIRQITQQLMPIVQILEAIANQPNVQPQAPGVPAPSGNSSSSAQGPSPAAAPPPEQPSATDIAKTQNDRISAAVDVGNMLATMAKAGIPISHGDVNAVFRQLGLPDLPTSPLPAVTKPHPEPTAAPAAAV